MHAYTVGVSESVYWPKRHRRYTNTYTHMHTCKVGESGRNVRAMRVWAKFSVQLLGPFMLVLENLTDVSQTSNLKSKTCSDVPNPVWKELPYNRLTFASLLLKYTEFTHRCNIVKHLNMVEKKKYTKTQVLQNNVIRYSEWLKMHIQTFPNLIKIDF